MSEIKQRKLELDAVRAGIDALDADLAAGRIGAEEHARLRAERERELGRAFMSLRDAQREARDRPPGEDTVPAPRSWARSPWTIAAAAVVLLAASVAAGVALAPRFFGTPAAAPVATTPARAPEPEPTQMEGLAKRALKQVADREDAPIPSLLQYAHVVLDDGDLAQARSLYDRVLARDPKNAEAITHLGAVLHAQGRVDDALAKVEEALRLDPQYVHAHWDRTQYLFYSKKDYRAAAAAAEAFLRVVPKGQDADRVGELLSEARKRAGITAR